MTWPEARATDTGLLVLHALRCAGTITLARLHAITGLDASDAESELIDLGAEGLVTRFSGAIPGWSLTDAGRAADAERITRELESARARERVTAAYERFLVLNPELLDLCTAWQLRSVDGVMCVNDHSDPGYDSRVLARFADLDRRADAVCAELAAALPRFGRYRVRLTEALERAAAGRSEYVADGTASYHVVWAELHEDLLATLGLHR
ncbi:MULTISPECIES: transcriptional regulator [Streptomyces]|uniref:transcriptional regulator n=1 Tax=Streptomyces TaxID=1883 RepID=UPI00163BFC4B|nr:MULTISPECIES: transcriptional regulator [Streptomyces]MBC2874268.1 transcriptional regulator [Streptomyces sp. TYQ1024]UBI40303.1 transcriptional regulator [Streptomyces mobaraensis]UKW32883.1 transcriptional regulator [Streptomyces sp. TYQ1024]